VIQGMTIARNGGGEERETIWARDLAPEQIGCAGHLGRTRLGSWGARKERGDGNVNRHVRKRREKGRSFDLLQTGG
jgi:hypothetical protein